MPVSTSVLGAVLFVLLVVVSLIGYANIREGNRDALTVSLLNVGENRAVFVRVPSGRQVLINGGLDDSILRALGSVMPFYDRSIDVVIATAPRAEDVGGLTSVLSRYRVGAIVRSAAHSGAPQIAAFDGAVTNAEAQGTRLLIAQRAQVIDLGGGASIEVLFPDRNASRFSASDGCLMLKLVYGKTSFIFGCGSEAIENYVAALDGTMLKSDVLLATIKDSELFVGLVSPQFAVLPCGISSGTSSALLKLEIPTIDTCEHSTTFVSDGQTISRE